MMSAVDAAKAVAAAAQQVAELERQVPLQPSAESLEHAAREKANQAHEQALKTAREKADKAAQKAHAQDQLAQVKLARMREQHQSKLQQLMACPTKKAAKEQAEVDAQLKASRTAIEQQRRVEQQEQRRLDHVQHRLAEETADIICRLPFRADQLEPLPFQPAVQAQLKQRGYAIVTDIPGVEAQPPYVDQQNLIPSEAHLWSMKLATVVLGNDTDAKSSQLMPLSEAVPPRSVDSIFDLAKQGTEMLQYAKHHESARSSARTAKIGILSTMSCRLSAQGRLHSQQRQHQRQERRHQQRQRQLVVQPGVAQKASRAAAAAASSAATAGAAAGPDQAAAQSSTLREELRGRIASQLQDAHAAYLRMPAARAGCVAPRPVKTPAGDFQGTPMLRLSETSCLVWRDCTWLKSKSAPDTDESTAAVLMLLLLDPKIGVPVFVCVPRIDTHSITFYVHDTKLGWSAPNSCAPHPPLYHSMNFDALRNDPRSLLKLKGAPRMPRFDTVYWYDKNGNAHFCVHVERERSSCIMSSAVAFDGSWCIQITWLT